ncbi:MAG TPA: hypothetical protein PKD45_08240 [Flavobacteriales bacterium]|nr:hypothetical protein [Flavobacteriales bacterium]
MKYLKHARRAALFLPLSALLWAGCAKEAEKEELIPEVAFQFDYPAMPVTLDSATVAGPGVVLALDSTTLDGAVAANHYLPSQLHELKLTKARLYFTSPVNSFYNSLKSVTVFMQESDVAAVQVAKLDPVPNGAQTLLLNLGDVDVLQMVRSNHARLILRMEFDGPMAAATGHVLSISARAKVQL